MRFSGILSVVAAVGMLVGASGCGDDKAGAIVNDDISWQIGCGPEGGCTLYQPHAQATVDQNFKVGCKRSGSGITITLRDPGFKGDIVNNEPARPGSTLTINNAIPNGACDVTVTDASEYGFADEKVAGSCGAGDCTFTGSYKQDGWDFIGELRCTSLKKANATGAGANRLYTVHAAGDSSIGVRLAIDNCD